MYFQVAGEVSHHQVDVTGDATEITSAKIKAHKAYLEKEFTTKTADWTSALSQYQSSSDQVTKIQSKIDNAARKLGGSSYNQDGSLSFFVGYDDVSHLRSPPEILRDLHRYLATDMLKLRQARLEILLQELGDSFDYEVASGRGNDARVVTNMSACRSVLSLLTRRGGMVLNKAEIVRKLVSLSCFSGLKPFS